MLDQFLRGQAGAGLEDDAYFHFIFRELGLDGDGRRLQNTRVRIDGPLHFKGRDILAPSPERILFPVDKIEIAVLIFLGQVPCMEPEIAVCLQGLFRHVVVSQHHGERLSSAGI